MPEIRVQSKLDVDAAELWTAVTTMDGVNAELSPWLRMSVPAAARGKSLTEVPLGELAFVSWLLVGGILPFDRHRLCLVELEPGRLLERSSSWLQRVWEHERSVTPLAEGRGAQLVDRVAFEPRLAVLAPLTTAIVARLFRHRHARLRARYGEHPAAKGERDEAP